MDLSSFPAEILSTILENIDAVEDLTAITQTCRFIYAVYNGGRARILRRVLSSAIAPEALGTAIAIHRAPIEAFTNARDDHEMEIPPEIAAFYESYFESVDELQVPNNIEDLEAMRSIQLRVERISTDYFHRTMDYLADHVTPVRASRLQAIGSEHHEYDCDKDIAILAKEENKSIFDVPASRRAAVWRRRKTGGPVSSTEKARIQRALYRQELFSRCFVSRKGPDLPFTTMDCLRNEFLHRLSMWEVEEMNAIREYIYLYMGSIMLKEEGRIADQVLIHGDWSERFDPELQHMQDIYHASYHKWNGLTNSVPWPPGLVQAHNGHQQRREALVDPIARRQREATRPFSSYFDEHHALAPMKDRHRRKLRLILEGSVSQGLVFWARMLFDSEDTKWKILVDHQAQPLRDLHYPGWTNPRKYPYDMSLNPWLPRHKDRRAFQDNDASHPNWAYALRFSSKEGMISAKTPPKRGRIRPWTLRDTGSPKCCALRRYGCVFWDKERLVLPEVNGKILNGRRYLYDLGERFDPCYGVGLDRLLGTVKLSEEAASEIFNRYSEWEE